MHEILKELIKLLLSLKYNRARIVKNIKKNPLED